MNKDLIQKTRNKILSSIRSGSREDWEDRIDKILEELPSTEEAPLQDRDKEEGEIRFMTLVKAILIQIGVADKSLKLADNWLQFHHEGLKPHEAVLADFEMKGSINKNFNLFSWHKTMEIYNELAGIITPQAASNETPVKEDRLWEGFELALGQMEAMYSSTNFQHEFNICDGVRAKFNRLDAYKIRPAPPVKEELCTCGVPKQIHGATCCGWGNASPVIFPFETYIPAAMSEDEIKRRWECRNNPEAFRTGTIYFCNQQEIQLPSIVKEEGKEETSSKLFDALTDKNIKVTFGLTKHCLEVINKHISKFENGVWSYHLWKDAAKELSWEPLTLALYYFKYLTLQPNKSSSTPDSREEEKH